MWKKQCESNDFFALVNKPKSYKKSQAKKTMREQ